MAHQGNPRSVVGQDEEKGLHRTTTGVTMSPELFERLYFTPKTPHFSENNKKFANPTALGFVGFAISASSFGMVLMGWGGASGLSPLVGIFFFTGPLLLTLSLIFEWIMGNFFSMMVMGLFSVFWLSFGVLQLPTLDLGTPFATTADPTGNSSPAYNAAIALYLIVWGFALLTFFVFTLKINAVFAAIFGLVTTACFVLSGAYWKVSQEDFETAGELQKAGGALIFIVALLGWYACFIIMAAEMRLPVRLPMGDLTRFWPATDVAIEAEVKDSESRRS
ncbi:GPR1/FUN34/yaaH family-domain-containing protein [Coniella lustricola]|uniref:GPR1/FUN34/yaaH family-domain-containing protein n=1 Tax=Coniella lustricola TaxID=2025994 RepID=A0A2T3AHP0_9PEZI|nr:GPR1/FUN34/yaaH family-domain-containing protein [Coniella lustricola]